MSAEWRALAERVGNGLEWLATHDPSGRFHLWFEAGLTPVSRMPAQDEEARELYRTYHAARVTFERLDRELALLEQREPVHLAGLGDSWQPTDPQARREVRQR